MTDLRSLRFFYLLFLGVLSEPAPGRIPKVYNALITSNQNLEPSKAYPVYQPVIHDSFGFPFQPAVFYGGDFPLSNGLAPPRLQPPKETGFTPEPSATPPEESSEKTPEAPADQPAESSSPQPDEKNATPAPPSPPNTQSPIPLNEFGLPSQVLPLGRFDPAFDGYTQVGPFTYSYPGFRFYDPYDPFSLSPYANLPPLYRPLTNVLSQGPPLAGPPRFPVPGPGPAPVPTPAGPVPSAAPNGDSPPSEPSDLNVLNYASKDPAIPNVPPPPLPAGGLKDDKSE